MDQYRAQELREKFIEMFCTVKTAVDNPMMNPSGSGGRRTFLVFQEGDLGGSFGSWAEDEEGGAEGFLDALEDVFCIWDDNDYSWFQKNKNQEKEKEKEKVILLKMKRIGLKMNGKEMKMTIGVKAIGMRQHGNPKAGINGKIKMNMDTSKEKERKERKEKERKVMDMDLQIKEKDTMMEKVKQIM